MYQPVVRVPLPPCGGPTPKLSAKEVRCLGLAAQWRSGVSWQRERGCLRHSLKHMRSLFPALTSQSAFHRPLRRLWRGFIGLQQAVAQELLTADDSEVIDGVPAPVAHIACSFHLDWLADIARIRKGGKDRYFYGLNRLLCASASGLATGWILAPGNIQDRWLAEGAFSARTGCPQLTAPTHPGQATPRWPPPPLGWARPKVAAR